MVAQTDTKSKEVTTLDACDEISELIQRGLEASAESLRLTLLALQAGYSLRAMEDQQKKAG